MRRFIFNILNSSLSINFNLNIVPTKILAAIRKILSLSLTSIVKTGAVCQVHIGEPYINLSANIFCFTLSQTAQRSANRVTSVDSVGGYNFPPFSDEWSLPENYKWDWDRWVMYGFVMNPHFLILLGCVESGIVSDETLFLFCPEK